jgi:hypothetical protein
VLLIVVAIGFAIFGMIHLTRQLQPGQRAVAWIVFILAVGWLFWKLTQLGFLGHATAAS